MTQFDDLPTELLTEGELLARYRGALALGTLRNWRVQGKGPPYLKIGRTTFYPGTPCCSGRVIRAPRGLAPDRPERLCQPTEWA